MVDKITNPVSQLKVIEKINELIESGASAVTSVNNVSPDTNGNVSITIPSINSTNNYVPYRSTANTLANSTLIYDSSAMAFTDKLHIGSSSPSTYSSKGKVTIYDSTPSQQVTSLALLNYGGGGGCGVAIDMYNTSANGGIPSGRFGVVDNGNYSGYLQLQVKKSGAQSNPLLPAMNIVPVPASNSLTTCVSFGQDEFNRVLFDLHKPEAVTVITDSDKRWSGSGTTYSQNGTNKFNNRLLVAVGDIVYFTEGTEARVVAVTSTTDTLSITTDVTLGSISSKSLYIKKAYFKITDESNNTKIYVDPYGKMGIGTLSPAYDLDVNGTINASTDVKVNGVSVLTGINSSDVTTALGYTPYNSTNPSGYQANVIETIKVNGTAQAVTTKTVDISIPSATTVGDGNMVIKRNGTAVGTFTANQTSASTINISVPTTASDVGALPDSTVIGDANLVIQKNSSAIGTFNANATSASTINIGVPTAVSELSDATSYALKTDLPTIDTSLSDSSTNPVQNKVITTALASKSTVTFIDWTT